MVASEPDHGHLWGPPMSGDLWLDDVYTEPKPMGWLRSNCSGLNSNSSISATVAASAVGADNILLNQESFDAYGFATNNAVWGGGELRAENNMCYSNQDQVTNFNTLSFADQLILGIPQPPSFPSGQISNLRCLIDYYDRVIPPVSATSGRPEHPDKSYILRLAAGSEPLQYAIAALSANYMRQRCVCARPNPSRQPFSDFFHDEFRRRYPNTHNMLDAGRKQIPSFCLGEQLEKEFYFKEVSTSMLNDQLGDMDLTIDDSLRAVILILCLDRVCGMGLANLKRQFASVAKILSLYGEITTNNNKAMTWLAIMFTWLDSMILGGGSGKEDYTHTALITFGVNEESWRLRTLAGCNGKLFDIVTKLGRLNLASGDPLIHAYQAANLGIGQILSPTDNHYGYHTMESNQDDGSPPVPWVDAEPDSRAQFWRERNKIRVELEGWQWEPPVRNSISSAKTAPLRQFNSVHVSESFRCAALLYVEWLTSSSWVAEMQPRIRALVERVSYHVSNVETDVSLLLPLFIAGLENSTAQRTGHLMGEGCLDLLEGSDFLKNVSALEISRHLWRGNDADDGDDQSLRFDSSIRV